VVAIRQVLNTGDANCSRQHVSLAVQQLWAQLAASLAIVPGPAVI